MASRSVADGEALTLALRLFELIGESDSVVLHGDFAVTLGVADELIFAKTELAGALAGLEEGCWTEAGPVDVGLFDEGKRVAVGPGDGLPLGGEMAAVEQGDSGSDFEAGCSADVEEARGFARDADLLDYFDEILSDGEDLVGVVGGWSVGADDGVGSLDVGGDGGGGVYVSLLDGEVGLKSEFGRVAGDRGDLVASAEEFGEDAAAGVASGSVEDDVHVFSPVEDEMSKRTGRICSDRSLRMNSLQITVG